MASPSSSSSSSSSTPVITVAEREYQRKFKELLDKSKILTGPTKFYSVSCAICQKLIRKKDLSPGCLYRTLSIVYCHSCSERVCPSGPCAVTSCDWCGNNVGSKSKLVCCTNSHCSRKFCKPCVQRIKEAATEDGVRRRTSVCVFCEPGRLLKEDRAVCFAIFRDEIEKEDKEKKRFIFEELECVICCNGPPEISFIPCRHACLCQSCLAQFKTKFNACPICSKVYTDTITMK